MRKIIFIPMLFLCLNIAAQSNIGSWESDEAGLPVFHYTGSIPYSIKTSDGKPIQYPNDPWFLIGNYKITAFVHTSGVYDLYTLQRAWGRLNDSEGKYSDSEASVTIDKTKYPITGITSSMAQAAEKKFGTGFASFIMELPGLKCSRTISTMPSEKINSGIPALIIDLDFRNTSGKEIKLTYTEALVANYTVIGIPKGEMVSYPANVISDNKAGLIRVNFKAKPSFPAMIVPKEQASRYDFYPPSLFLAGGKEAYYTTDSLHDNAKRIAANFNIDLKPGESKHIQIVAGYAFEASDGQIRAMSNELFNGAASDALFRKAWKQKLPSFDKEMNIDNRGELLWNAYVLEATAKYNSYFDETFIPQGMIYDYMGGTIAATRDLLIASVPESYCHPQLSKSILRMVMKMMLPSGGISYGLYGFAFESNGGRDPSDFQIQLFWAMGEYLKNTSDYSILTNKTNFYPKQSEETADGIEKLRRAFSFLRDIISTGPHGLIKMLNADWNDQIWSDIPPTMFYMAESQYNSSMAIIALGELASQLERAAMQPGLAEQKKDIEELADAMKQYRQQQLSAFMTDLGNRSFARRAWYDKTLAWGDSTIHLESQLYTLMIPEIPIEQKQRIIAAINTRLLYGECMAARLFEEKPSSKAFEVGTRENGGVWYYTQGMLACALTGVDKKIARKMIDMLSFHNFAKNYPDYWPGQWSAPDALNSSLAKYPGLTDVPDGEFLAFPVYCSHVHLWPIYFYYLNNPTKIE